MGASIFVTGCLDEFIEGKKGHVAINMYDDMEEFAAINDTSPATATSDLFEVEESNRCSVYTDDSMTTLDFEEEEYKAEEQDSVAATGDRFGPTIEDGSINVGLIQDQDLFDDSDKDFDEVDLSTGFEESLHYHDDYFLHVDGYEGQPRWRSSCTREEEKEDKEEKKMLSEIIQDISRNPKREVFLPLPLPRKNPARILSRSTTENMPIWTEDKSQFTRVPLLSSMFTAAQLINADEKQLPEVPDPRHRREWSQEELESVFDLESISNNTALLNKDVDEFESDKQEEQEALSGIVRSQEEFEGALQPECNMNQFEKREERRMAIASFYQGTNRTNQNSPMEANIDLEAQIEEVIVDAETDQSFTSRLRSATIQSYKSLLSIGSSDDDESFDFDQFPFFGLTNSKLPSTKDIHSLSSTSARQLTSTLVPIDASPSRAVLPFHQEQSKSVLLKFKNNICNRFSKHF